MSVTFAGNEYTEDQFRDAYDTLRSNRPRIVRSDDFLQELGQQYDGERDIYDVLGYSKNIEIGEFRAKYERQDIAQRIVELPAIDTWKEEPTVAEDAESETETAFDRAVEKVVDRVRLWRSFARVDIVTGIGQYGLLFLGVDDGQPLDEEIGSVSGPDDLSYVTPFSQDQVIDWETGRDVGLETSDDMYDKPVEYTLSFSDPDEDTDDEDNWEQVHHSRVIHIAEGKIGSEIKGKPRLRPVFNRLDDLQKVIGASAEMFYSGADQKYHFNVNTQKGQSVDPSALDQMDEEIQQLVHDMEKSIKTINTDMEVVGGQEVDPTGVVENIMKFIAGAVGIPRRILTGSERGELASTQDKANWYGTVAARQTRFAEPEIVRAFFDRLIEYGLLPLVDDYDVKWSDLFELNELEQAKIAKTRAQAVATVKKGRVFATGEELFDFMLNGEVPEFEENDLMPMPQELEQAQFDRGQQLDQQGPLGGAGSGVAQSDPESDGTPDTSNVETHSETVVERHYHEGDSVYEVGEMHHGDIDRSRSSVLHMNEKADLLAEHGFVPEAANKRVGAVVDTPDGKGVVVESITDIAGDETLPDTDLSPTDQTVYVVALVPGGHDFYTAGDLESATFDVEQPASPSDAILASNSGVFQRLWSVLPFASNDWSMPDSWVESDRPTRLILLDAWASMGGTWTGAFQELGSKELASSMKDAVLGTELWRGGWAE